MATPNSTPNNNTEFFTLDDLEVISKGKPQNERMEMIDSIMQTLPKGKVYSEPVSDTDTERGLRKRFTMAAKRIGMESKVNIIVFHVKGSTQTRVGFHIK